MPDLKVRHPAGLFTSVNAKQNFMEAAASRVAIALESLNYSGEPFVVDPESVDVQLMPYAPENAKIKSLVVFELAGYDFPDRMSNLRPRMVQLKAGLSTLLWKFGDHEMVEEAFRASRLCTVLFLPVSGEAWV